MQKKYCVIMAGGVGSRFWPLSTSKNPKQFLDILGTGKTMIRMTFERFQKHCPVKNIWVVTSQEYKDLVLQQIPELEASQVLTEPYRRNTAPCIAYACYKIGVKCPDAQLIISPADHLILNTAEFDRVIEKGFEYIAENPVLLTLGIKPSRPETGYGYIQIKKKSNKDIVKVKTFTEKPDQKLANVFYKSGEFLWNSGMFMWSVKDINNAIKEHLPDIDTLFIDGRNYFYTSAESDFIKKVYEICPIISIDYGVMEKANNVFVLRADFGWSDIGTWGSLFEYHKKDKNENALEGDKIKVYDSENCYIRVPKDKLIIVEGLKDYIVVDSGKVILVCKKKHEQKIRQIVNDVNLEFGKKYI